MPGLDKLEIAWAEDRATQGCDLSADPSADRSGAVLTVAPGWPCWPESDKSQGFGGRAPIWKKGHLPFEKTLTNGGESWSARVPLDPLFATGSISSKREGRPGGRPRTGGPPHNFCRPSGHGKNERHWADSLRDEANAVRGRLTIGRRLSACATLPEVSRFDDRQCCRVDQPP